MKRVLSAILISVLMCALSVWNLHMVDSLCSSIFAKLDISEAAAEAGNSALARSAADEALELWLEADGYTHIFIRHAEIDGTSDAFYELLSSLSEDESSPVPHDAYNKIRYHLDSLARIEHPSFGSVL